VKSVRDVDKGTRRSSGRARSYYTSISTIPNPEGIRDKIVGEQWEVDRNLSAHNVLEKTSSTLEKKKFKHNAGEAGKVRPEENSPRNRPEFLLN